MRKNQIGESSSNNSVAEQIQKVEAKSRIKNNSENLKFFRRAFGATLILTFGVVYLQGLGIFHLSNGIIYSLCTAIVGELAGLFTLSIRQNNGINFGTSHPIQTTFGLSNDVNRL